MKKSLTDSMSSRLEETISLKDKKSLSNLSYLISLGIVEVKIAFVRKGIFHDKVGIFTDEDENIVYFRGSNNETEAALITNYEAFSVHCSWILDESGFYKELIIKTTSDFRKLWNNKYEGIVVKNIEDTLMTKIMKHNKGKIIIEEAYLEDNCLILDYMDQLFLNVRIETPDDIIGGSFYKVRLKKYVEKYENGVLFFKNEFSYRKFIEIDEVLLKRATKRNIKYLKTKRLEDFIESRNMHIESRAKIGIGFKKQDNDYQDRFETFKNVVDACMVRKLRDKQMWDALFMTAMMKSGNFSVPGSGKTSSVLGMYAYLKYKGSLKRIVMIGPKNSFGSWIDEFVVCFGNKEHLKTYNIHNPEFKNSKRKKIELKFNSGNKNLFLFNYESVSTYMDELKDIIDENTLLVFDEVHQIKKFDEGAPGVYAGHSLELAKNARYVVTMTGTPIPNSYKDIYNMLNILFPDDYDDFFGFSVLTLKNPSLSDIEQINDKIQPFFCRTTKEQLQVPKANADIIINQYSTYQEQRLFEILMMKYRKNKLALMVRLLQLESDPTMLLESADLNEFKQILDISGEIENIDFADFDKEVYQLIDGIEQTTKTKACIEEVKTLVSNNKTVIVWCIFKKTIYNLDRLLKEEGISVCKVFGEIELVDRYDFIESFKNGKYDVLITNPHTLAESVSLHKVCHDSVYFEYSYNLVHLLQSKDRIHRLGLSEDDYTQYRYLQLTYDNNGNDFSLGENIYNRLSDKEKIMLEAIENNVLGEVTTTQEDLEIVFSLI